MKTYRYFGISCLTIMLLCAFWACSDDDDNESLPLTVETGLLKSVGYEEALCGGEVTSGTAQARGVCWSTTEMPTLKDAHTTDGKGGGEFVSQLTGLNEGTHYYVRAYATGKNGEVVYGEQKQCTTMAHGRPVITLVKVKDVKESSAVVVPQLLVDGGVAVSACGILYGRDAEPTESQSATLSFNVSKNPVDVAVTDLEDDVTYYVKAFAIYDKGTVYSHTASFTTKRYADPELSATLGTVSGDEMEVTVKATANTPLPIMEYGLVYATSAHPTYESSIVIKAGEGDGEKTLTLEGLQEETYYYIRPYVINKNGLVYGEELSASTLSNKAVVRTVATTQITAHRAFMGGEITDLGLKDADILEAGICWSTAANPSIEDNKKASTATALGEFEPLELFCLNPSTTYHVRAYVTNSYGTSYGDEVTFKTREPVANFWAYNLTGSEVEFNGFYMGDVIPDEQSDDQKEAYKLIQNVVKNYGSRTLKYYRFYIYPDADGKPAFLRTVLYYTNTAGSPYSGFWDAKMSMSEEYHFTCSDQVISGGNAKNIQTSATNNNLSDDLYRSVQYVLQGEIVFDWDSEISETSGDNAIFRVIPLQAPEKYKRMKPFRLTGNLAPLTSWN